MRNIDLLSPGCPRRGTAPTNFCWLGGATLQPTEPPSQGHAAHFKSHVLCILLLNYKSSLCFLDAGLSAEIIMRKRMNNPLTQPP